MTSPPTTRAVKDLRLRIAAEPRCDTFNRRISFLLNTMTLVASRRQPCHRDNLLAGHRLVRLRLKPY
ncbi:MAG: hypothetical protein HOO99_10035 [Hyphomicrobiaceae bacterium]|nr:hypothetical protein [Hyphomicrobiaceae bacterium]